MLTGMTWLLSNRLSFSMPLKENGSCAGTVPSEIAAPLAVSTNSAVTKELRLRLSSSFSTDGLPPLKLLSPLTEIWTPETGTISPPEGGEVEVAGCVPKMSLPVPPWRFRRSRVGSLTEVMKN